MKLVGARPGAQGAGQSLIAGGDSIDRGDFEFGKGCGSRCTQKRPPLFSMATTSVVLAIEAELAIFLFAGRPRRRLLALLEGFPGGARRLSVFGDGFFFRPELDLPLRLGGR